MEEWTKQMFYLLLLTINGLGFATGTAINTNLKPTADDTSKINTQAVKSILAQDVNLDTLKHVQIFFRHGDRSPAFDFPKNSVNISENWPTGLAQLTAKGKSQSHELGQFIRKRYRGFLMSQFHPNEIYVQSSDFDRTIMAALSVLGGLYVPTGKIWDSSINWDPVPLRTIPVNLDNKLSFDAPCPVYRKEYSNAVRNGEGKVFKGKSNKYYEFIATSTGLSNVSIETITELFDTLYIQHLNGFPLPDWAAKPFPGEHPFLMRRIAEHHFDMLTSTNRLMKLRGGPIYREILRNIEVHRNQSKLAESGSAEVVQKMILYSGHDTTLSTVLQALGVYEPQLVPYSAAVIIELHKSIEPPQSASPCTIPSNASRQEYYVKILYRNCTSKAPLELFIPNCGSKSINVSDSPCTLTKLRSLKKHLLEGNWRSECFRGYGGSQCPCLESEDWCPVCMQTERAGLFENFAKFCKYFFLDPISNMVTTACKSNTKIICKALGIVPCY